MKCPHIRCFLAASPSHLPAFLTPLPTLSLHGYPPLPRGSNSHTRPPLGRTMCQPRKLPTTPSHLHGSPDPPSGHFQAAGGWLNRGCVWENVVSTPRLSRSAERRLPVVVAGGGEIPFTPNAHLGTPPAALEIGEEFLRWPKNLGNRKHSRARASPPWPAHPDAWWGLP